MTQGTEIPIESITLRGGAGALAGWEVNPPLSTPDLGTVVLVPGFTGSKEDFERPSAPNFCTIASCRPRKRTSSAS
jgi:hypothetical protein